MAKITFENGKSVNFNGTPTQKDIEEVAKKLGIAPKTKWYHDLGQDIKQTISNIGSRWSENTKRIQEAGKASATGEGDSPVI